MPYVQIVRAILAGVLLASAWGLSGCGTPDTSTTGVVPTAAPPTTAPNPTPFLTAPIVQPSSTPLPPPTPSVLATPSGPVQSVGVIVPELTATSVHSMSLQNDWNGFSLLAP